MTGLRYIRLQNRDDLPGIDDFRPFKTVVVVEDPVETDWQAKVSRWLIDSGCVYMMAWGRDCKSWHDSVDAARDGASGHGDIPDDEFVVTTWHHDETLSDVFRFAEICAVDEMGEIDRLLILHIGSVNKKSEFEALYGSPDPRRQIISCWEHGTKNHPPQTLREAGLDRIIGRQIVSWMNHFGDYGMGGPGFFELELTPTSTYPREHLVLTIWVADQWLLLDGQWVGASIEQWSKEKPLFNNVWSARRYAFWWRGPNTWDEASGKWVAGRRRFGWLGRTQWDEVSAVIVGSEISGATVEDRSSQFILTKGQNAHVLEVPRDLNRLPLHGNWSSREWHPDDSLWDAWVVTERDLEC